MKFSLTLALALLASPAAGQTFTLPFSKSVANSGQPGLQGMPLFLSNSFGGATFDDRATLRVDRDVETASGGGKPPNYTPPVHAMMHFASNPDAPGHIPMGLIAQQIAQGVKTI